MSKNQIQQWSPLKEGIFVRYEVGDRVCKRDGYEFPGVVVAVVEKLDGQIRYVVECTEPAVSGMLHIFNGAQLTPFQAED